ncbi:U4/U6 snRNP-specific spliceosomal protein [Coprinopsis sp. MPI-PUGE-AT-0042]|nr:U4/U6 snRNP-specific spliceosomal protein [Coprinopsis sp. MPI-PUGE-AT-0042]
MAELTYDTLVEEGSYLSERARQENKLIIDELERKKKARGIAAPTDDNKVKARLREIGEPITLFGERAADRRDRLIYVLSQINAAKGDEGMDVDEESESDDSDDDDEQEFYSPGSLELLESRRRIAEFSLPRAQKRIAQQRLDSKLELARIVDIRKKVFTEVKKYTNLGSQIGDERPIAQVRFAPNNQILATGSWSGTVKLWNVPQCTEIKALRGHSDKVSGVAWHPQATLSQSPDAVNLVSGAGEGAVNLWSLNSEQPISVMQGHIGRVCRVAFHPSGEYVASAGFDKSWRLWDVSTAKELLWQEGHSREVYAVEFQNDGALIATGGLDAIGRVWDLRTGRTAMVLNGHAQAILSMSFSPNAYQIATGSSDDTIRIWDMRAIRDLYTIPAHTSNVSDVRFFHANDLYFKTSSQPSSADVDMQDDSAPDERPAPSENEAKWTEEEWKYRSGLYFASSGYDGLVKIWSADDWQLLRTLSTDAGKVMSVDITSDGNMIASGTYNRNFQLYAPEEIA